MARVTFKQVSKRFDDNTLALRDFSLTIEDGELVVLVGPSGCGKSTALRLLAGLEDVTSGEIWLDDAMVNRATPQQRNIAMVFQNYALYPHMSVRANLEFPLRMAHVSRAEINEQIRHIADILDLSALLERRPKQLSGGQRQRVAMGRALVRDPSVFLLDEPLSNLDARLRAQIRADIARLQRRLNKTTLYVTHDQVEAMTLGDRVAVMNAGELQQLGTPDALYQRPKNTFVAKFIGSPGMNIILSVLQSEEDGGFAVHFSGQKIDLSRARSGAAETLAQHINEKVYAGIRPEAITVSRQGGDTGVSVQVQEVEFLGHESLVYFSFPQSDETTADAIFIARVAGKPECASGEVATFYVDPEAVYLFDQDGRLIQ